MRAAVVMIVILALGLAACESITDTGRPLTVSVSTPKTTVAVSESLTFRVDGTGRSLAGLVITYGDGAGDSIAAQGAQTAGRNFSHAYAAPGTFEVSAFAVEFTGPRANEKLSIQVVAGGEPQR